MADLPSHAELLAMVGPHRAAWSARPASVAREPVGPGQESVWDFPRPPQLRPVPQRVRVVHGGQVIAETDRALEMIETASAPVPYIPPEDAATDLLTITNDVTLCEWKGAAVHYDLRVDDTRLTKAAFTYPDPLTDLPEGYGQIAGWFGFYPAKLDACFIGEEQVRPQPGGLYAGWVTQRLAGPIKGGAGTGGW